MAESVEGAKRRRPEVVEVIPSAARTISTLRNIGYELPQAVADLVDNSIAANATRVAIELHFDGGDTPANRGQNPDTRRNCGASK